MTCKYMWMVAGALSVSVACSSKPQSTPASPTTASAVAADANADGTTLKVSKPTPQSPVGGQQPQALELVLTLANASAKFASGMTATYRFQIFNAAGVLAYEAANIPSGGSGVTSTTVTTTLEGDQPYTWKARVEIDGQTGPWSDTANFVAPATNGYIRGNELYDPLLNGKTVGEMHGPLTFIPGVGIKLESQLSYVSYVLPTPQTQGEFSMLVTGMPANTDGDKTKLFAMGRGFDDIVTNLRRMTVEKRGDPPGIIAWRLITREDQIDTEGAEREFYDFKANQTYFWQATWKNNFFNVLVREGGVDGRQIYSKGKPWKGREYEPDPHVVYIGAPVGRSGEAGASVDQAIIRQVWVSNRPRPAFANK